MIEAIKFSWRELEETEITQGTVIAAVAVVETYDSKVSALAHYYVSLHFIS